MSEHYLHRHLSPAVRQAQQRSYGQTGPLPPDPGPDRLGPRETAFIAARDSVYLASVTESGAPYLQHRGGPAGFLRVLDPGTLAFADLGGNRQLLTVGHLSREPRLALFLMDYPARRRLKLDGVAEVLLAGAAPELADQLRPEGVEPERVERLIRIHVEAFDWNCPQWITPRYTATEMEPWLKAAAERATAPLLRRIAELEAALAAAQAGSAGGA
jgi:predicted pyridoxine 5'-phosphate oxidase superfamily flavin-nucleotide-binding protein